MSRSLKKTPISGITKAESEKEDKRLANRRHRRVTKIEVNKGDEVVGKLKEVSNVWSFEKDGKRYLRSISKKDLRK
ncbi:MAG: hypothetical protein IPG89_14105 [Bacteroidetes bacterium]|nr:hypothetical protein [Bacteroidota bacterium]